MLHSIIRLVLTLALLPAVVAAAAAPDAVAERVEFAGRTEASTIVEIRGRVSGHLEQVLFAEGDAVKKGQLLFQLDDRSYRAEVEKAQAELAGAEARMRLAEAEHRRATKLLDARAVSREEVDKLTAALEVERAGVLAARAAVEHAKLNLDYTRIVSPIDGRTGRALAAGNLVRAGVDGGDVLTMISVLDPLHVHFRVDERTLLRLHRLLRERKEKGDRMTVSLGLAGEEGFPRQAVVDFTDNQVDPQTGTILVRAVLPNPKGEVLPGQAVRVRVSLGTTP